MPAPEKLAAGLAALIAVAIALMLGYDYGFQRGQQDAPAAAYTCGVKDGLQVAQSGGGRDALPSKGAPDSCAPYRDKAWR